MTSIVQTDDVLGGEPRIEGTRIGVLDVYELVVEGGYSPADVADQLDRSLGEIYTALAYYHGHPEQMRSLRQTQADTKQTLATETVQPPETIQ